MDTFLNKDFVLNGNLRTTEGVRLEGYVTGSLLVRGLSGRAVIEGTGRVGRAVSAEFVECFGKIQGNVQCRDLVFDRSAAILGGIKAEKASLANGKRRVPLKELPNQSLEIVPWNSITDSILKDELSFLAAQQFAPDAARIVRNFEKTETPEIFKRSIWKSPESEGLSSKIECDILDFALDEFASETVHVVGRAVLFEDDATVRPPGVIKRFGKLLVRGRDSIKDAGESAVFAAEGKVISGYDAASERLDSGYTSIRNFIYGLLRIPTPSQKSLSLSVSAKSAMLANAIEVSSFKEENRDFKKEKARLLSREEVSLEPINDYYKAPAGSLYERYKNSTRGASEDLKSAVCDGALTKASDENTEKETSMSENENQNTDSEFENLGPIEDWSEEESQPVSSAPSSEFSSEAKFEDGSDPFWEEEPADVAVSSSLEPVQDGFIVEDISPEQEVEVLGEAFSESQTSPVEIEELGNISPNSEEVVQEPPTPEVDMVEVSDSHFEVSQEVECLAEPVELDPSPVVEEVPSSPVAESSRQSTSVVSKEELPASSKSETFKNIPTGGVEEVQISTGFKLGEFVRKKFGVR